MGKQASSGACALVRAGAARCWLQLTPAYPPRSSHLAPVPLLPSIPPPPTPSHPREQYIHEHKTAALLEAAVVSGALLGGAGEVDIDRLRKYSRSIGLAFQVRRCLNA